MKHMPKPRLAAYAMQCLFRPAWLRGIAVVGVLLIVCGQWLWFEFPASVWRGASFVLVGGFLVGVSIKALPVGCEWSAVPDWSGYPAGKVWAWKLPFVLVGVGLTVYAGWYADREQASVWAIYLLWFSGIWFTMYGLVPHEAAKSWRQRVIKVVRSEWGMLLLVLTVTLAGAAVRLVGLSQEPYIMAGDEAAFAIQAADIRNKLEWVINPFKYGAWHHPYVYHTLIAASITLFGQTMAAARLPSAILGALTVPAGYLLGRRMVGSRVGVVAAIFLAAFPLHVHFSRLGINQVGDPLFSSLAFAFLARAFQRGDAMEAALGGAAVGLSQYFYSASRIIPLLLIVFVVFYALLDRRWVWRRMAILGTVGVVAGVVVFPGAYAIYRDTERPLSPRLDQVSVWATGDAELAAREHRLAEYWQTQVERSLLAYVQIHDESGFFGSYSPILGWFAGVPFLIGVAMAVRRWRDPRAGIVLVWIAGTAILGGVLLVDPPHYPRYVSATPAIVLLVATGLAALGDTVAGGAWVVLARVKANGDLSISRLGWSAAIALSVMLALADVVAYTRDYLPRKLVFGEATVQLNEAVAILDSFEGRYQVWYFSSGWLDLSGTSLVRYLSPANAGTEFRLDEGAWPADEYLAGPQAFIVAPERYDEVLPLLVTHLPDGELREYTNRRSGQPLLYVYLVDA